MNSADSGVFVIALMASIKVVRGRGEGEEGLRASMLPTTSAHI